MSTRKKKGGARDDQRHRAIDAQLIEEHGSTPSGAQPDHSAQDLARADAIAADASTALVLHREQPLFGSRMFFTRAVEELTLSTELGMELAGAAYARQRGGRTVLVGLVRQMTGEPGRVPVDPAWGSVLWHTHPGLRGSLAAFSIDDLEVARRAGKPLLVIGFGGLSAEVLSTLALPFGLRAFLASAGLKGVMLLEKRGILPKNLLRLGVAARVCWPSGQIQPILRAGATPLQAALDEMSFAVDRGVGAVERTGQQVARQLLQGLFGGFGPR
jgi:hypothetical protein